MAKNRAFFKHFDNNIYQTETLASLKLGYKSRQGLLLNVYIDEKLLHSVTEVFLSQLRGDFKMESFRHFSRFLAQW
jgi:hypothetical protein